MSYTHTLPGGLLLSGAWMENNCAFKTRQERLQLKPCTSLCLCLSRVLEHA